MITTAPKFFYNPCAFCFDPLKCDGHSSGVVLNVPVTEPDRKETNPKDAIGSFKAPISTVSARVMAEVGLGMLEGALKYGRHNYRVAGVRASVYYDAVVNRHLAPWWEGQDIDPDSDLSHVVKAITALMVLRDSMLQGNWVDDRPPKTSDQNWVTDLNARAKKLIEKYPNPPPAFTEKKL